MIQKEPKFFLFFCFLLLIQFFLILDQKLEEKPNLIFVINIVAIDHPFEAFTLVDLLSLLINNYHVLVKRTSPHHELYIFNIVTV